MKSYKQIKMEFDQLTDKVHGTKIVLENIQKRYNELLVEHDIKLKECLKAREEEEERKIYIDELNRVRKIMQLREEIYKLDNTLQNCLEYNYAYNYYIQLRDKEE